MKVGRKTNLYKKIKRLLSEGGDDRLIGKELLLANMRIIDPEDWYQLNKKYPWAGDSYLQSSDIQKYLYDKRQEEIRANKGGDIQEDKSV